MKWKDSDGGDVTNAEANDPYYEDDGYAAFKEKGDDKPSILAGIPMRYLYWGVGIAAVAGVVVLLLLLFSNINGSGDMSRIKALEERIESLAQRLEKYEGMDEKVKTFLSSYIGIEYTTYSEMFTEVKNKYS